MSSVITKKLACDGCGAVFACDGKLLREIRVALEQVGWRHFRDMDFCPSCRQAYYDRALRGVNGVIVPGTEEDVIRRCFGPFPL